MEKLIKTVKNVDWEMLRSQKETIMVLSVDSRLNETEQDAMHGILHLIESIQDSIVDDGIASEIVVFDMDKSDIDFLENTVPGWQPKG